MSKQRAALKIVVILSACCLYVSARDAIRVQEVRNCPGDVLPIDKFDLSNISLRIDNNGETFIRGSGYIARTETMDHGIIVIKKCDSIDVPEELCQLIMEAPFYDICDYIIKQGQVWSPLVALIKPKLECPLEGTYVVEDAAFDVSKIKRFQHVIGHSVLRIQTRCYLGDDLKACAEVIANVQTVINRRKKKKPIESKVNE